MSRRLDPENFVAEKLAWHQRIASDPKISLQAKAVAGFILHDLKPCVGGAWRGQESMATSLGVSPRQLRRLLEELKTVNYLEIEVRKGRGRTNICRATLPDEAAEAPENRTSATRKPITGDRQYLMNPLKDFAPPQTDDRMAAPERWRGSSRSPRPTFARRSSKSQGKTRR
jgi:hypothetical protein